MKDPTTPDPQTRKKFMFYDTEKRQTDLKIKLRGDYMNQSMFFRVMITGYLDNDPSLMQYLDKFKGEHSIQGENMRRKSNRMISKGQQTKEIFALDPSDIESFFDIMEEEHPDL